MPASILQNGQHSILYKIKMRTQLKLEDFIEENSLKA
jgi:hypothetical protein